MPGRPLKVGIQLPEVEWEARWPDLRAMALRAEELGFDSVWTGDHLLYRRPGDDRARGPGRRGRSWPPSPRSRHASRSGRWSRPPRSTPRRCWPSRRPRSTRSAAGRLVLGLGAGWNETEFAAFGFPFDHRISRFAEAFTIIRTLLREGAIDFAGEFFTARDCELVPRPRPGGPPLMIGSTGPRMLEITAPHVDSWNAWFDAFGNRPAGDRGAARPGGRRRAGGRARSRRDRADGGRAGSPARRARPRAGRDRARRRTAGGGVAEEIAATLRAFAAEGIAHVQLVVDPITLASIEALAPVLEDLDRG